jgi:hypothetical protein
MTEYANGSSTTGWQMNVSSQLMQDYLLTSDILVQAESDAPIACFLNASSVIELLVVDSDSNLQHVYPDPTSSSGWNIAPVGPAGVSFSAVAAGNDSDGSIHGFAISASGNELYHLVQNADGTWTSLDMGLQASNVMVSMQPYSETSATQVLVAYGTTPTNSVFVAAKYTPDIFGSGSADSLGWCKQSFGAVSGITAGMQLAILPAIISEKNTISWAVLAVNPSNVTAANIALPIAPDSLSAGSTPSNAPNPAVDLTQPFTAGGTAVPPIVVDGQGTLWAAAVAVLPGNRLQVTFTESVSAQLYVTGLIPSSICLTTQNFQNLPSPNTQVYLLDTSGGLWVIRWTESAFDPSYVAAAQLVGGGPNGLTRIFTPQGSNYNAQVFAIDSGAALCVLQQDPVTTQWTAPNIQQPCAEYQDLTTYSTKAALVDINGVPVANTPVTITASAATTIWVQGVACLVDATQSATVNTDGAGRLTIVSPAFGLGTPALTFSASGLATPVTMNPAQDVQSYLSGNCALNALPQFTATTLQIATVPGSTSPLAPGLTSEGATAAVQGIGQAFALGNASSSTANTANQVAGTGGCWQMNFTSHSATANLTQKHATFQWLTPTEAAQHRAQYHQGTADSLWSDFKHIAGDVWHAIKTAAIKVVSFVVDTVNKVISLVIEGITDAIELAISGFEDVVNVVHTIFTAIGAAIEDVVSWLRSIFDWEDINNTRIVLEYYLNQTTGYLQNLIGQGDVLVNNFFQGLESQIQTAAQSLQVKLTGQTLSSLGLAAAPAGATSASPGATGGSVSSVARSPQGSWVADKMGTYGGGSSGLALAPMTSSDELTQAWTNFKNAFETAEADFKACLEDFYSFFQTKITDPSQFATLGLDSLIGAIAAAIQGALAFADAIVQALLALVELALEGMGAFLTQPMTDIPLLSSLYQDVCGEPMTVAGLVSLAVAVPLTIGYKLLNGADNPPFTAAQVTQLTGTTPSSSAQAMKVKRAAEATEAEPPSGLQTTFAYLAAGTQGIWSLIGCGLDIADSFGEDVVPPTWLPILDVPMQLLSQIFTWPGGTPFTTIAMDTDADKWTAGAWYSRWAPVTVDGFLLMATALSAKGLLSEATIMRFQEWGKVVYTGLGLTGIGLTLAACVYGGEEGSMSGWGIAANVLGGLPPTGQFLRLDALNNAETLYIPALIQAANDIGSGGASALLMLADAADAANDPVTSCLNWQGDASYWNGDLTVYVFDTYQDACQNWSTGTGSSATINLTQGGPQVTNATTGWLAVTGATSSGTQLFMIVVLCGAVSLQFGADGSQAAAVMYPPIQASALPAGSMAMAPVTAGAYWNSGLCYAIFPNSDSGLTAALQYQTFETGTTGPTGAVEYGQLDSGGAVTPALQSGWMVLYGTTASSPTTPIPYMLVLANFTLAFRLQPGNAQATIYVA